MGIYFANHTSLTDCLNACISLYSDGSVYCSGVDVSTATIGCWFHFNDSDLLSPAVQWTVITQYRRVENCSSNGKLYKFVFRPAKIHRHNNYLRHYKFENVILIHPKPSLYFKICVRSNFVDTRELYNSV